MEEIKENEHCEISNSFEEEKKIENLENANMVLEEEKSFEIREEKTSKKLTRNKPLMNKEIEFSFKYLMLFYTLLKPPITVCIHYVSLHKNQGHLCLMNFK